MARWHGLVYLRVMSAGPKSGDGRVGEGAAIWPCFAPPSGRETDGPLRGRLGGSISVATIAVLFAGCLAMTGCGLVSNGRRSRIPVRSDPSGATVTVDGAYVGETPLHLQLDAKQPHVVILRATGYRAEVVRIEPRVEPAYIVMDVFIAFPAGLIVDATTGGWFTSDREVVALRLVPDVPVGDAPAAAAPEPPVAELPHAAGSR